MTEHERPIPHYFVRDGEAFVPSGLARNPWFANAVAGGPIAALIGQLIEEARFDAGLEICRLTIDILGVVPHAPLTARFVPVREGRQAQFHRIELLAGDRPVTQAHLVLARGLDTPPCPAPQPHPAPEEVEERNFLAGATMAGAIRTRPIMGEARAPGRGVVWMRMDGEVVLGTPASPFAKACLFADFGNGVGSATHAEAWSYANLDISIQFFRRPRGEWFLLDAFTEGAGNGHAVAQNLFADIDGVYAKGTQTIFVAPGRSIF
ncbi:acyl-CoA thioesterase domain-containing protein [Sphingopyxis panaciterrulae]|uniref:Acyl-coenzyme A thioesterase PaaI-like protein n=1 Tax=Sphingopyxis panaciterrulae TaxID=462372 RepID=A0A7W9EQK3_9SPHN|nr:acyl-CoA thioesterase domain-containing protein [Sphingopyxis panaciterrulae]MBB5706708.1 acyl-coenzyme A thioesterase PaaI-like protein [Sphingopyxis panaciterrulae]